MMSDEERGRQQAEPICYDDLQIRCNAVVPHEDEIAVCMNTHRIQPSAVGRKVFDAGAT